ncbi:MAG: [FeFe] hydrogenase H-cluster radical SAM maturase HydE [Lentisphaeria bacterium]|nr:[FeFe] hydrogenase H-cluster radical SAM maturase HydE [Lentisphaeria bacterium]
MHRILMQLQQGILPGTADLADFIVHHSAADRESLFALARQVREQYYGRDVYIRGLIEFSNHCRNNCIYCGIRAGNRQVCRYRLSPEEILACCRGGYALGFRTFVLQGGEDPGFPDEMLRDLVAAIHAEFPDCAITLSVGERERSVYQAWFDAGATRYLLRHETADPDHYARLHTSGQNWARRVRCLHDLKEIGYQVGAGFMVGSPGQTPEMLAGELHFLKKLQPQMVGIGPFLPHKDTPFAHEKPGSCEETLLLLALIRLILPNVLLPATTALATGDPQGRVKGLLAGANVVMPNLSPEEVRGKYLLYNNKVTSGKEAAGAVQALSAEFAAAGFRVVTDRGDCRPLED